MHSLHRAPAVPLKTIQQTRPREDNHPWRNVHAQSQLHRHPTFTSVLTNPASVQVQRQSSRQIRGRRSDQVGVQVVLLAELVCDGDAGEILAPVALHRVDVEEDGQGGEEAQEDQQEDADLDPLPVHV